jgi:DNA repair protein RadC
LAPELDMSFLDHLIVSSQGVFSFRSAGLIGA